ncbi:helicase C-terminal domain-containing protein [Lentinula edodes]|uniref:ATP-dependent DNA helicase CHL1 n=1 Tax=Lentinula edodes TaxID=5353 RepID=A0A1Q3EIJ1_LENED|nr:helicase C-terminal domain-containing protein [Lentinula edodes]GAW07012.1 DNA repair helicase [Lentinula edodes]
MSSDTLILPTPEIFSAFPYTPPYNIQVQLMRHLYEAIENRKVTVIESPTGTGKTSSLLCAGLTWLHDEKNRARKGKLNNAATGDDWVSTQTRDRLRRQLEAEELEYEQRLADARQKEAQLKSRARVWKKPKPDDKPQQPFIDADASFLPEDDGTPGDDDMNLSPAVKALMARMKSHTDSEELEMTCTKIYYASRTHSQLTQVLPELRKLKIPGCSMVNINASPNLDQDVPYSLGKRKEQDNLSSICSDDHKYYQSRALSLGSRKHLCINAELRGRVKDIDEGCRELLAEKKENRCPYLPPVGEEVRMNEFRDQILATPKDIEDLALSGRVSGICPYFASRKAIPQAELITLPYNLLLQKSAREALGIDLKDQIVVVDEGHNLIPTLLSLSTVHLSLPLLQTALYQVTTYVTRFRNKLNPANLVQLKRLLAFLDALAKYSGEWRDMRVEPRANGTQSAQSEVSLTTKTEQKSQHLEVQEVLTPAELIERMGRKVLGLNMLEIVNYLKKSKIARKISGYAEKLIEQAEKDKELEVASAEPKKKVSASKKGVVPPLHVIEDLMTALAGATDDGRISLTLISTSGPSIASKSRLKQPSTVEIKYHLLNPAPHFRDVVDEARAVIIAGGTMSPISDVQNQLFFHLPPERITSFSCGHIIPPENVLTVAVTKGPSGRELDFRAGKQGDSSTLSDLGQIILNFTRIIPGGMIVFFPSYKFLENAKSAWALATGGGYLEKFGAKKKVFFEPEDQAAVEGVLQQYATAVAGSLTTSQTGALLLAVIGAKLSEGLNFADDLARAVVIVGLPFANLASAELRERMRYVKREEEKLLREGRKETVEGVQRPIVLRGKDAAAELYENMCMNAVNQSIGRAIRHRSDWAALLLLDQRYSNLSIRGKLPKWLGGDNLVIPGQFGGVMKQMGTFFRAKGRTG